MSNTSKTVEVGGKIYNVRQLYRENELPNTVVVIRHASAIPGSPVTSLVYTLQERDLSVALEGGPEVAEQMLINAAKEHIGAVVSQFIELRDAAFYIDLVCRVTAYR